MSVQVAPTGRHLIRNNRPYFLLSDTAWTVVRDLTLTQAISYVDDVASRGFTCISLPLVFGDFSLNTHVSGIRPFFNNDLSQPNDTYFEHAKNVVDYIYNKGLDMIIMLPWMVDYREVGTPQDHRYIAEYYAYLLKPYRDRIIWDIGGDAGVETDDHVLKLRERAKGLHRVLFGSEQVGYLLITYHPAGDTARSTMQWGKTIRDEAYLTVNGSQPGHFYTGYPGNLSWAYNSSDKIWQSDTAGYPKIIRPGVILEPCYEMIARSFNTSLGPVDAADVRHMIYMGVFAGAFGGVAYGHNDIWQTKGSGYDYLSYAWSKNWNDPDVLGAPGRNQVKYLKYLMESRPLLSMRPLRRYRGGTYGSPVTAITESTAEDHVEWCGDIVDGGKHSFVFIYLPSGRPVTVDLTKMSGSKTKAWWFNPRTGQATAIGEYANSGTQTFTPSGTAGDRTNDWVLVLDDASRLYGTPGLPRVVV